MRWWLGGLALAIVFGWTTTARAEPLARLSVTTSGEGDRDSTACVSEEAIRLAVARRLGTVPFDAAAEDLVEVTVAGPATSESASPGRRAAIVWTPARGRGGTRTLTASDCAVLTERIAVSISVLLENRPAEESPHPATTASSAEREPSPFDEPEKKALPPAAPSTREAKWRLRGNLHGGVSVGSTPAAAASAGAGLEIAWLAFAIGAGGRADLATSTQRADGKGVAASLLTAELFACGRVGRGRGHERLLGICALGLVGALLGEGINVSGNDRATSGYAALGPRLTLDLPLGAGLGIRGLFDVLAPFTRATLRVEGDPVWTAPIVQVHTGLGLTGWIL